MLCFACHTIQKLSIMLTLICCLFFLFSFFHAFFFYLHVFSFCLHSKLEIVVKRSNALHTSCTMKEQTFHLWVMESAVGGVYTHTRRGWMGIWFIRCSLAFHENNLCITTTCNIHLTKWVYQEGPHRHMIQPLNTKLSRSSKNKFV